MRPKIYTIGVTHTSKKDGERILKHAEDLRPEAMFIERPEKGPRSVGANKLVFVALRNPIFLLAVGCYMAILTIPMCVERVRSGEFGIADVIYTKRASKQLGIPIHKVDDDIYEMTVNRHVVWTPISWTLSAILLVLMMCLPTSIFLLIIFLSVFSFLKIFAVDFGIPIRNQRMMARIENTMKSGGHEKAFLITGKGHVRDFKERLSKKFDVEVLDP